MMMKLLALIVACALVSCRHASPLEPDDKHDIQSVKIFFHYGLLDELDTFHGTYQKDLVMDGTVKTTMWLTTREQEIILTKLENFKFFTLPDTIRKQSNVIVSPDMGPQVLRVSYQGVDKTVVWYETAEPNDKSKYYIDEISRLLYDIIVSKPEYKALPPANGLYL